MTVKIVILICGIVIGSIITGFLFFWFLVDGHMPYVGILKWMEDEDGQYPYIEGEMPFDEITRYDYIILKVDVPQIKQVL